MKNLLFLLTFLTFFSTTSQAQIDIDNLFGGANAAYANPVGDFSTYAKGGFSYNLVVGYKIKENIGVGFEYGGALTAAILPDSIQTGILGINLFGLESYLLKGWYQFGESETFKPYASVGLGVAVVSEPEITTGTSTIGEKRTGLGASLELGVVIKSFNISYSFNASGRTPKEPAFTQFAADLGVNYHRFGVGYIYNF
jgi:hypothetical protein